MEKPTFPMNKRWIIIHGNPGDGFGFWGPFATVEEATKWAEDNLDRDWWIADLLRA